MSQLQAILIVAGAIILVIYCAIARMMTPPEPESPKSPEPVFHFPADEELQQPEGVTIVYFGGEAWYKIKHAGDFMPRYERVFKSQDDLFPKRPGVVYSYVFDKQ